MIPVVGRSAVGLLALLAASALVVSASSFSASTPNRVSGASPFASCTADHPELQSGTNVPNSEVEPWVVVNPTNPNNIVGAWQQDRWSDGGARGLVAGVSTNGGASWTSVAIPHITLCSGGTAANGGDFQRATDPWLSFSPNGELYMMSLSLDITPPPGRPGGFGKNAMLVSKSTDGGFTWSEPITLIRDENPRFLNDKNSITADPHDASFVYAVWDRLTLPGGAIIKPEHVFGLGFSGPAYFARTTNGGASWEQARKIYDPGANNQTIGNQIVVLPDGTLLGFFNEILNFRNDEGGAQFEFNLAFVRSTDRGRTWTRGRAIRVAKMQPVGVVDPESGDPVRTADVLPDVAVDPKNGNLYAVWQDGRFSNFQHESIAFSMSTNGGRTWSTPIKVNQTPTNIASGNQQAFTPSVEVLGDGTVGVTYYDFRNNDSGADLKTDYFLAHCHADCSDPSSWGSEVRITPASFDMRKAPVARGFFVGDYEGLASDGQDFLAFFSEGRTTSDPASVFFSRVGP